MDDDRCYLITQLEQQAKRHDYIGEVAQNCLNKIANEIIFTHQVADWVSQIKREINAPRST